jgi:hypothetical protein
VNALIASTPADVSSHSFDDLCIGWRPVLGEQRSCLHDLTSLTETTLRNADFAPSLLNGVLAIRAQTLDRRNGLADRFSKRRLTRADSDAIEMNRACTAYTCAASEFRARQIEHVPDIPEEGHVRVAAEFASFAIDSDG